LTVVEKWNEKPRTAEAYNVMGIITMQEGDFGASEQWFLRTLPIGEELKMYRTLAIAYRHLGILTARKTLWIESGEWLIKARRAADEVGDSELIELMSDNFAVTYEHATGERRLALANMWHDAGLGSLPSKSPKRQQGNVAGLDMSPVA
jgi:hypothetical protein